MRCFVFSAEHRRASGGVSGWLARAELKRLNLHCPICKKPTSSEANPEFPFCSDRCRLLDLGNWASGHYVVSEPVKDEAAPRPSDLDESEK